MGSEPADRCWAVEFSNGWRFVSDQDSMEMAREAGLPIRAYVPTGDRYRTLLERLVVASDGRPDDPEWLEALYAARNALRDDPAKETDG
jgi:hypothetical protein